jgi:ABC-type nitrate/sulfonate/bicarbonate transport system substrate-binding protein
MSPPADEEGRKMGFNMLVRAYELFSFPFVGLGTHSRKLKEKPDEVKRTIRALIKANRFIRQNRDGTIVTLTDWGRTTPALAAASYDSAFKVYNLDGSIPDEGLLAVIDQAVRETKLTRQVAVSEVADTTLLREAQKELGIKRR